MTEYRVGEAAALLGVSEDTVRRWADSGRLTASIGAGGRRTFDGVDLARFARKTAEEEAPQQPRTQSARNRFAGIVTNLVEDKVMAQVDIQAGHHRFVSVITREAADELGLTIGMMVDAVVKATNVGVELP